MENIEKIFEIVKPNEQFCVKGYPEFVFSFDETFHLRVVDWANYTGYLALSMVFIEILKEPGLIIKKSDKGQFIKMKGSVNNDRA